MSKKNSKNPNKTSKNQVIYGIHSVEAAISNNKRDHIQLILSENMSKFAQKYMDKIKKIQILDKKQFRNIYGNEQSTQGIVLITREYERPSLDEFIKNESKKEKSIILVLDQITDPQNIGSIMRSCALFNCKGIIVSKDNAPELTPSLLKAASGASELVNYFKVTNLKRTISNLKQNGYWVYGFDSSESNTSEISFDNKSVLVFGSEGKGIRKLIKKECDIFIKLSIQKNIKYNIDSLNVSNATSIALWNFYNLKK